MKQYKKKLKKENCWNVETKIFYENELLKPHENLIFLE